MPPPGPPGPPDFLGSGLVAISASVASSSVATLTALLSAALVTLVGSTMPFCYMSPYSPRSASKPKLAFFSRRMRCATTVPSKPALAAICCAGRASAA